jgi:DNA segregation ATPase FtsK/SpoIIIE-like protein
VAKSSKQDERIVQIFEWGLNRLFKISKRAGAEFLNIRSIFKTKEKFLFICYLIISYIFLIYNKAAPGFYFINPILYFFIKGIYKELKENAVALKYKGISKIFDNKVRVIESNKNTGTFKLNSFIPLAEIEKKLASIEHFLNREIETTKRDPKNFRLITIKTKIAEGNKEKKLKQIYLFEEYLHKIENNKKHEIMFATGIDEKGNILLFDLIKLTNTFIAGMQGGGKSNLLNVIIQSMMYLNDNIFYIMVDFKGGVELYQYSDFNNTTIIEKLNEFNDQLLDLEKEMDSRYQKLKASGTKKLSQYNKKNPSKKISYIVLIIDEMSDIRLTTDTKLTDSIENTLTRIMNQGRAAGIIVIGATQRPSGSQINTNIRDRFGTKFSARIKDKNTQRMAGIYGTENLKDGEFLMEYIEEVKKFKAFFIDEIKYNKVYEDLSNKLHGGVNLDKIN